MKELPTVTSNGAPKSKRAYKSRGKMSEAEKLMRDLDAGYKHNRKMIEQSMAECGKGTNTYLAHVKALDAQLLEYARFRREIGMLPKSIAAQATTQYVFKAHVAQSGNVTTVPVSSAAEMKELERSEEQEMKKGYFTSEEDEAIRARFEAEFGNGAVEPERK
jgi:hypothetical protein